MARLILSLDGSVMAEFNMNRERYTIGRLPDNDIRIDNPAVSGHHSLIINILNDSFLEDLNSTNGTYVNGKLIKKHALQHGDVITAGHHQLRFVEDDDAQQDEFEKTLVIQPSARPVEKIRAAVTEARLTDTSAAITSSGLHSSTGVNANAANANAILRRTLANGTAAPKKAKLQVLSGAFAGRELELSKALTTLGRPGVQVAAITRRSEGFFIVHVDGEGENNFPLVNGAPIGAQARRLADNDVIQLAGVKMGFFQE
jgi:pSer/pThr/pTyr-binding forkhead associated (FHA) protein